MSSDDKLSTDSWTILKTLQWTADYFKRHGIDQGRPAAEILLAHCLGCQRIDLYLRYDQPLHADELARFRSLIQRRVQREPDAYIIGYKEFWSLSLQVSPAVLIPRPETECLIEAALRHFPGDQPVRVLELGTGSGAISIALAHERAGWHIQSSDISIEALNVARQNARRLKVAEHIEFINSSWFDAFAEQKTGFDLIVSNPPYVASGVLAGLEPEVRQFEPARALDGGRDGMDCLRHIVLSAPGYLKPGGMLIMEMGYDQRSAMEALGRECGSYDSMAFEKDYSGLDRIALFRRRNY